MSAPPSLRSFRLPAEWEPHEATWLTWPHFEGTWPGMLERIEPVYVEMVRALHTGERVHINALDGDRAERIRDLLKGQGIEKNLQIHIRPTDNEWIRDYGALTVVNAEGKRLATDWRFNNWGEKYPDFDLNNEVPAFMADHLGIDRKAFDIILEGGAIDTNGDGLLITTESCLLNPNRNPHLLKEDIEKTLREAFGVREVLWLGEGIEGDDTDGHVDDVTRFVGPRTAVTVIEQDPADANHEPLLENLRRLQDWRPDGSPIEVIELPMPRRVTHEGERLPASYANFYIGNRAVLLPVFDDPSDSVAVEVLARNFPDREVVAIDCRNLVWGFGAFHCLTQQVPAGRK